MVRRAWRFHRVNGVAVALVYPAGSHCLCFVIMAAVGHGDVVAGVLA